MTLYARLPDRALDALILAAYGAAWAALFWFVPMPFAVPAVLVFLVPVAFLGWRRPKQWVRDLWGALLLGPVLTFLVDYAGVAAGAWGYGDLGPVLSWKVAHMTSLGIGLWTYAWALSAITIYEHFFEHASGGLSRRFPLFLFLGFVGAFWLIWLHGSHPSYFDVNYLFINAVCGWPILAALVVRGWRTVLDCLWGSLVVALLDVPFELAGLLNGYWHFGGHYVAALSVRGAALPLEEMIGYTILGCFFMLCNFELFVKR